jgi:N-acetylglucosamine malate deacetylase 1
MKKKILAIGAHPDDIEIGCGGTISILKDQGHELTHLIITSGEEGSHTVSKIPLAKLRETEAKKSAQLMKVDDILFFHEADGSNGYSKAVNIRLISIIRKLQPDIIFTHAKSDHFPDHQAVHQLTQSAILAAAGPWYPDAGISTHQVNAVYGYEVWNPISEYQLAMNITTVIDKKIAAIQAHESQTKDVDYVGAIRGLAKYRGVMTMAGEYAEVFEVLKIRGIQ